MRKLLLFILIGFIACNIATAQSLGRMTLGCKRTDIPLSLPKGFNVCKTNTSNQLTYTTDKGNEHVSFYLNNGIVYKIEMHKFIGSGYNPNNFKGGLEEIIMNLYEIWGEPSYIGENIYWQFSTSKATFSHKISSFNMQMRDPHTGAPVPTYYTCYADIKLEKRTSNLFE